jgi:hypothetical protein
MISYTPWYIILGEFGIAVVFALLARILRRDSWLAAVVSASPAEHRFLFATRLRF